ncbi:hypothetical protein [Bacillus sp. CECT 9360]|uniref:hypothetical protein n=1 Tax=Bacillus sp. CECT 9360 TaxID=2845821 RepID=UPI001E331A9A|nr:hypothetical protein [Bacillus sp. CECT 9360]
MKDKTGLAGQGIVLHKGHQGQNRACGSGNCPSYRSSRTKLGLRARELSFIQVIKDKTGLAGQGIVLHTGQQGQNGACGPGNCPSYRSSRTKPGLRARELSFIQVIKDKTGLVRQELSFIQVIKDKRRLAGQRIVLHTGHQGQNGACGPGNCPS